MKTVLHASCLAILCFASVVTADYSTDPNAPLSLIATASDDVQAKIAAGPNNSHYISCFTGAGYDVSIARLDKDGKSMWKSPTLVKDRGLSSTTDYGMASDSAGNAYVAFDSITGRIECSAVSPTGAILWNTIVTTTTGFVASAQVTVASDGFVWVAHIQDATTRVQRLDPLTGAPTFATPIIISETSATQNVADIEPSLGGAVIVSCVRYVTFNGAKILRAHRIEANGTKPWAAVGVSVFTTGSLQFGNYPQFIADGAGGGYFAWYANGPLQCWVQRIDANGTPLYGVSGTSVTTTTTFERVDPSMVVGTDNRLYVFWAQHTPNSSIYGVYGQCFAKGVRQWGISGAVVEPMATVTYSRTFARGFRVGDNIGCSFDDSTSANQDNVRCVVLAPDGSTTTRFDIATSFGNKYRFVTANAVNGGSVIAWQGGLTIGSSDVWVARVNADGTLGPPTGGVFGDLNADSVVNAQDLAILLDQWGGPGTADLVPNGVVNSQDLAALLNAWTSI